jgi:hypothetical protein
MDWIETQARTLEALAGEVDAEFSGLPPEMVDYKPDANSWSINECFDHLIQSNGEYYALFDALHTGNYRRAAVSRVPFLSRGLGRLVLRVVSPDYKGASRTSQKLYPRESTYGRNMTQDLLVDNQVLVSHIRKCSGYDLERVVTSPIFGLVAYSLRECIQILVHHEARHVGQARRVKALLAKS